LENLVVENSQNEILKMYSKTLEWEAIPLMDFKKNGFENKVGMFIPELEAGRIL
jgi:hypothetical protein